MLTAGYAGSRSTHILGGRPEPKRWIADSLREGECQRYTLGCGPGGAHFLLPYGRPSSFVANNNDVGRARYDSLQIKAETKNARHGLYALLDTPIAHF